MDNLDLQRVSESIFAEGVLGRSVEDYLFGLIVLVLVAEAPELALHPQCVPLLIEQRLPPIHRLVLENNIWIFVDKGRLDVDG